MNEQPDTLRGADHNISRLSGALDVGKSSPVSSIGSLVNSDVGGEDDIAQGRAVQPDQLQQQQQLCRTPANGGEANHPQGLALTQRDCVVWKESLNSDLLPLSQATPPPPNSSPSASHRASSTSSAATASAGGAEITSSLAVRRGKSRTARARSAVGVVLVTDDGTRNGRHIQLPPSSSTTTTATVAPSDSRTRASPLESVTKCLVNCVEEPDVAHVKEGTASRAGGGAPCQEDAAVTVEIDNIYRRLERDQDPSSSSSASAAASSSSPSSSDATAQASASGVGGNPVVAFKSRKRRRHHNQQALVTRPQSNLDGKENAANRPSNPAASSSRQASKSEVAFAGTAAHCSRLESCNENGESSVLSPTMGGALGSAPDPFQDLLREVRLKQRTVPSPEAIPQATKLQLPCPFKEEHQRDVSSSVAPENGSVPCCPRETTSLLECSELMSVSGGMINPPELSQQALPTPPARPSNLHVEQAGVPQDEFGDVDFSMEDLALIDSMVHHATQEEADRGDASQHAVVSSAQAPPHQSARSPDPFGDFPEMDFDALDKSIADQQENIPPISPAKAETLPAPSPGLLQFTRYRILQVHDDSQRFVKSLAVQFWTRDMVPDTSVNNRSSSRTMAQGDRAGKPQTPNGQIHLCGDWYFTPLVEGDVIHVCSPSGLFQTRVDLSNPLALDTYREDDLLLIVHPDMLLTPTTISETVTCSRRAVLKNRLGSTGLSGKSCPLMPSNNMT
jgi:DNA replication factor Dna2